MKRAATVILASSAIGYAAYKMHDRYRKKAVIARLNEKKEFTLVSRKEMINKLKSEYFDILVIGGGSAGAGCALDASTRGLRTALVERGDFGSETSSKSTKLLHGGIRYLEKAFKKLDVNQFLLVKEGLRERSYVMKSAPYLTKKLDIMLPVYSWIKVPYFLAGLKVYDLIAGFKSLGSSYFLGKRGTLKAFPALKTDGLKGSVVYADGQFDDARLNVMLCLSAAYHGAAVANYAEVSRLISENGRVSGAVCKDVITGEEFSVHAKGVINSTGPFMDSILRMSLNSDKKCSRITNLPRNSPKGVENFATKQFLSSKNFEYENQPKNESLFGRLNGKLNALKRLFGGEKSNALLDSHIDNSGMFSKCDRKRCLKEQKRAESSVFKENEADIQYCHPFCGNNTKCSGLENEKCSELLNNSRVSQTTKNNALTTQSDLVAPSSGVHVVLPPEYAPTARGLVLPETKDGRILFFIPWKGRAVIGTTDRPCAATKSPGAEPEDVNFLLQEIQSTLRIPVTKKDILAAWCGIRPLVRDPSNTSSQNLVRNHLVFSKNGLTSLCGGKWTTYRQMAEDAVSACIREADLSANKCVTRRLKILGAHALDVDTHLRVATALEVSAHTAQQLVNSYGDRAFLIGQYLKKYKNLDKKAVSNNQKQPVKEKYTSEILKKNIDVRYTEIGTHENTTSNNNARTKKSTLEVPSIEESTGTQTSNLVVPNAITQEENTKYLLQAETEYSIDHEMACKISDILARRSRIAFTDNQKAQNQVASVAAVMAEKFGWDSARTKSEIKDAHDYLDTLGLPKNM